MKKSSPLVLGYQASQKKQESFLSKTAKTTLKQLNPLKNQSSSSSNFSQNNVKAKCFSELSVEGYTQEKMGIKNIYGDMIETTDHRYLMMIEIYPTNLYQKDEAEQDQAIAAFESFFYDCPTAGQFKYVIQRLNIYWY